MNYPRIYSISTVGILKHYVHDYLLHPLRTDFIGPNGVGKSILADLLQLLFIYDTDIIRFGTDGIRQEKRTIYELPYKTNIAYCSVNIEVKENKFIIIGIAIHSQIKARITPFVITKASDITQELDKLCLTKEELLLAEDYLQDKKSIPDLKTLATSLAKNKNLYLQHFRNKDDANKYYQFLYDKHILSISLSVGENLKAFAKVIQSFSKAKSLDLRPANVSKSLKDFLFEDSDEELFEDYTSQQHLLEKLLREYARLDQYIKILEQKQQWLTQLKRLDNERNQKNKIWMEGRLSESHKNLNGLKNKEMGHRETLEKDKLLEKQLKFKKDKIPQIEGLINSAIEAAHSNYDQQVEYQKAKDEVSGIGNEINDLKLLNYPVLANSWRSAVNIIDIDSRRTEQILELINWSNDILRTYTNLDKIEKVREDQAQEIRDMIQVSKAEIKDAEKLLELIEGSSEESIVQWVVSQNKPLTKEQGSVLLHYALLPTKELKDPKNRNQFVNPQELLFGTEFKFTENKNGVWIKLGAIQEFIEWENEAKLFVTPGKFHQSIKQLIEKLSSSKKGAESKLTELEKITKGHNYNKKVITKEFDLRLIEYTNITKVKEAVSCILQLNEKIESLRKREKEKQESLQAILRKMPVNPNTQDPDLLKQELKKIRDRQQERKNKFVKFKTTLENSLNRVIEGISGLEDQLFECQKQIIDGEGTFHQLNKQYFEEFSQNLTIEELSKEYESESILKERYNTAETHYQVKYEDLISRFDETKEGKNIPVNLEIQSRSYSFRVLEEALLGNKITYTDDIAAALTEANASRLNMADEIKNNMVKIFDQTVKRYKRYKELVQLINDFFKGTKISGRFYFKVEFSENKTIQIGFVEEIGMRLRNAAKQGELAFDRPVGEFIEEFFKKAAKMPEKIPIEKLLSPKTYFDLSVSLTDENNVEVPGSTGETYSAIALLGISRLSLVQSEKRSGIRFIILEEIGSLDNTNYNTFPAIAKEYGYQIITMAPHPFRTNLSDEWYAHHLIKGNVDGNINFHPAASYFKTKDRSQDLFTYLKLAGHELDRTERAT